MANGSPTRPRTSGVFSGLLLMAFGFLLLLHNYGHLHLGGIFLHWWPLIFIFWGVTKLYERLLAQRQGRTAGWITPGEVLLVIALLAVVGIVIVANEVPQRLREMGIKDMDWGDAHEYDLDVPAQPLDPRARITVRVGRGDITVRPSDDAELRITGKKTVRSMSESEADQRSRAVDVAVTKSGQSVDIHPTGYDLNDFKVGMNLDIQVPKNATLNIRTERGDVSVSDMGGDVTVVSNHGDVEVNDTAGNVDATLQKGDAKVTDTHGDVKVSGRGSTVEVTDASGSLTVDGDFYSSIRADKIAKGVRFVSQRTDLTLTQLGGHLEKTADNLEIADAPGNLTSRTRNVSVSLENIGGKIVLDNTNGAVELNFSNPPKEDITINNERAAISLNVPSASNFTIQADCRSCDISSELDESGVKTTRHGDDSHLEGKAGSGRGPKIVLKTSYDSIQIRKTM